jgi:hypothetical protein
MLEDFFFSKLHRQRERLTEVTPHTHKKSCRLGIYVATVRRAIFLTKDLMVVEAAYFA